MAERAGKKKSRAEGFISKSGAEASWPPMLPECCSKMRRPNLLSRIPREKKLGWAVVGLGSLAINQILPAFAKCEKSKVVALVSGHPDKAK